MVSFQVDYTTAQSFFTIDTEAGKNPTTITKDTTSIDLSFTNLNYKYSKFTFSLKDDNDNTYGSPIQSTVDETTGQITAIISNIDLSGVEEGKDLHIDVKRDSFTIQYVEHPNATVTSDSPKTVDFEQSTLSVMTNITLYENWVCLVETNNIQLGITNKSAAGPNVQFDVNLDWTIGQIDPTQNVTVTLYI